MTETKASEAAYKLAQEITRKGIPTLRPKGVDGTAELAALIDVALKPLREALKQWKCPACGGSGQFSGYSKDAPQGQPCRKCKDTNGLHPIAARELSAWEPKGE